MTIISKIRDLFDFKVEPGFSVGAGLKIVFDSSGTGYYLVREDGTIVLEWGIDGGMISVTTSQLTQPEKSVITRAVRVIRPGFTPDWGMWRTMRLRTSEHRTLLAIKGL